MASGGGGHGGCIAGKEKSVGPSSECAWGRMTRLAWLGHRVRGAA